MTTDPRTLTTPARWLLQALAAVCVLLGLIGVVVPVLPTVPFLVVAAWAASRSSPRLHRWLMTHRHFGPPLREWNEFGIVPRPAKWLATTMITISAVTLLVVAPSGWTGYVLGGIACIAAVMVWLWRRPEQRPTDPPAP